MKLDGYKTIIGAVLILIGGAATAYGATDIGNYAFLTGGPMLALGIGHKLDKILKILHLVAAGLDAAVTQAEKAVAQQPGPVPAGAPVSAGAGTPAEPPKA